MALNGTLDDYSPAGALRVLSSDGRTGAVRFAGGGGTTVYLHEGQLYFARGPGTDDALASALVRPGRLTPDMWTAAVDEAGESPRVGQLLIEHGSIDPDLLASVVLSVIYDPLINLFRDGDGDGQFEFEPDTMHWSGSYRGFNVEAIVNEVRRRVRSVDEMSDVVPSLSAWVSPRRNLPNDAAEVTLLREDWELVTSLSGPRTIVELAASMGRGQYSTAAIVARLARAGLLEVVAEPFSTQPRDACPEPSAIDGRQGASPDPFAAPGGSEPDDSVGNVVDVDVSESTIGADGDIGEVDEDAWERWAQGNPFAHDPSATDLGGDTDLGGVFGSGSDHSGPEAPPEEPTALAKRSDFREDGAQDSVGRDADDLSPGLTGITGFHDPVAGVGGESVALAQAVDGSDEVQDPNAVWLENLYAQFIDETGVDGRSTKEALDVAFQAPEQAETEKVGTLRRLVDALRRV